MKKYVYMFSEGNAKMRELLGGKGANLAEMTVLQMPVPQGFTVTTEACTEYHKNSGKIPEETVKEIFASLKKLEDITGKTLGGDNPLLLSVRSGARVSMPGMMDTVLNLGINDKTVLALAKRTENYRFAYDSYRRFIQMFSDVVKGLDHSDFERIIDEVKRKAGKHSDAELNESEMVDITNRFKAIYRGKIGNDFPQEPKQQLIETVEAVFRSWDNPRANYYRRINSIPHSWGTAVNVQEMVFGNMGGHSGTGVAFTRNPATGENKLFGEFLLNAQGEDVVAGIRTPNPIEKLENVFPDLYRQFSEIAKKLENHYKDVQDMEFTVENGKLFMLQTRTAKRTAAAALKIAVELAEEKMISKREALMRVEPNQLELLLHPQFDTSAVGKAKQIGKGLAASPGASSGKVVFSAEKARSVGKSGENVILVRLETSPEDIEGMASSKGILTARGGMTSHAAVVARGMGICCVSGCNEIEFSENRDCFTLGGEKIHEGDFISLDGSTGCIYLGELPTVNASISGDFEKFMSWADSERKLKVFANADSPSDASKAVFFGAEGIGLCRTEHMFFTASRIKAIREMIVARNTEERQIALDKLIKYQQSDFEGIFRAVGEKPVTIRFLDPPLHEFLPKSETEIVEIADELNMPTSELRAIISSLHEFNPMLGHRGCRLAISFPEIARMQTEAVIKAAVNVQKEDQSKKIVPEIMLPLISDANELKYLRKLICETAQKIINQSGLELDYTVGAMIEVPRAAVTASEIAQCADFFSFGTNDLTQMTFGLSRDDAGKFLESYYQKNIYEFDPFATIDTKGVGSLMTFAVKQGKQANPNLTVGICGEHAGNGKTVEFCHSIGLDYVSCSPFRVPTAKLASAQAAINESRKQFSPIDFGQSLTLNQRQNQI